MDYLDLFIVLLIHGISMKVEYLYLFKKICLGFMAMFFCGHFVDRVCIRSPFI